MGGGQVGETVHRQLRAESLAGAQLANAATITLQTVRDVRRYFLELYYQVLAKSIVTDARGLFAQLVDITRSHYASGRVSQQDVLRSSLELSRLDDRRTQIHTAAEHSRAELAKWIGDAALLPVSTIAWATMMGIKKEPTPKKKWRAFMKGPTCRPCTWTLKPRAG